MVIQVDLDRQVWFELPAMSFIKRRELLLNCKTRVAINAETIAIETLGQLALYRDCQMVSDCQNTDEPAAKLPKCGD